MLKTVRGIERLLRPLAAADQREVLQYILSRVHSGSNGGSKPVEPPREPPNEPVVQNQVQSALEPAGEPCVEQESVSCFFSEFWSVYPRKQGKQDALRIYRRLKPDRTLQDRILKAVHEQKASEQWTREYGRFIPLPKTWLNRGSWDDEPQVQTQSEPRFGRTSARVFKRFIERGEPQ